MTACMMGVFAVPAANFGVSPEGVRFPFVSLDGPAWPAVWAPVAPLARRSISSRSRFASSYSPVKRAEASFTLPSRAACAATCSAQTTEQQDPDATRDVTADASAAPHTTEHPGYAHALAGCAPIPSPNTRSSTARRNSSPDIQRVAFHTLTENASCLPQNAVWSSDSSFSIFSMTRRTARCRRWSMPAADGAMVPTV